MDKLPYIPKGGIRLPYFDDTSTDDLQQPQIVKDAAAQMKKELEVHLNRLIFKHKVTDIPAQAHRIFFPRPNGWVENYYINNKPVLVVVFIVKGDGKVDYQISEVVKKSSIANT
jgi:hypothetical protein